MRTDRWETGRQTGEEKGGECEKARGRRKQPQGRLGEKTWRQEDKQV